MLMGDVPIFVAHDSADVWARPDLFYLDNHGQPLVVAGVPPDYFSETGQLWGNPLYGGRFTPPRTIPGGTRGFPPCWPASTSSGSTIFAALRPTGRSRPDHPPPRRAAGFQGPAVTFSRPSGGSSAHFR